MDQNDFLELMQFLSIPRPNGSPAERQTANALKNWLAERDIPTQVQRYTQYPYYFEWLGLWLILSRTALVLGIWMGWGWPVLPIALVGLAGGLFDHLLHIPLVTWPGRRKSDNLLIQFEATSARSELILCAHYDSKTELLDHRQRMFLLRSLPAGILLTLLLGILGPLDGWMAASGSPWSAAIYWLGVVLSLPLLILAWMLGLNLCLGRLLPASQGAVDNGAACAILLGLADYLVRHPDTLKETQVTIALFSGEEINLQGSRAYARAREWPLPVQALNLEVMAQDGDYVYWEEDGSVFGLQPTSPKLNAMIALAVQQVTGRHARPAGPVISDGASFLAAGVPAATLGSYDSKLVDTGFHRPSDNLTRVVPARLSEGVEILLEIIRRLENESGKSGTTDEK